MPVKINIKLKDDGKKIDDKKEIKKKEKVVAIDKKKVEKAIARNKKVLDAYSLMFPKV